MRHFKENDDIRWAATGRMYLAKRILQERKTSGVLVEASFD
jgi:hypothetical protein